MLDDLLQLFLFVNPWSKKLDVDFASQNVHALAHTFISLRKSAKLLSGLSALLVAHRHHERHTWYDTPSCATVSRTYEAPFRNGAHDVMEFTAHTMQTHDAHTSNSENQ